MQPNDPEGGWPNFQFALAKFPTWLCLECWASPAPNGLLGLVQASGSEVQDRVQPVFDAGADAGDRVACGVAGKGNWCGLERIADACTNPLASDSMRQVGQS